MAYYSHDHIIVYGPEAQRLAPKIAELDRRDNTEGNWEIYDPHLTDVRKEDMLVLQRFTRHGPYPTNLKLIQEKLGLTDHYIAFTFEQQQGTMGVTSANPQGELYYALPSYRQLCLTAGSTTKTPPLYAATPPITPTAVRALFGLEYVPEISPYFGVFQPLNTPLKLQLHAGLVSEDIKVASDAIHKLRDSNLDHIIDSCDASLEHALHPPVAGGPGAVPSAQPYSMNQITQHIEFLRKLPLPQRFLQQKLAEAITRDNELGLQALRLAALLPTTYSLQFYGCLERVPENYQRGIQQAVADKFGLNGDSLGEHQLATHLNLYNKLMRELAEAKLRTAFYPQTR